MEEEEEGSKKGENQKKVKVTGKKMTWRLKREEKK